jgi:hypothetical protein
LVQWCDFASGEMLDNKRGAREVWPTDRHRLRFQPMRRARVHTTKALPAFAGSFKERWLANCEIDRKVGEHDAIRRTEQAEANTKE